MKNNFEYLFISDINLQTWKILSDAVVIPNMDYKQIYTFIQNNNSNYQFIFYDNTEKDKKNRLKVVKAELLKYDIC